MANKWTLYSLHRHCLTLGYYPSTLRSYIGFLAVVTGCQYAGYDATFGLGVYCQRFAGVSGGLVCMFVSGTITWLALCLARKLILKRALSYRGWMYEGKNVSSLTICVLALVRLLNGWSKPLTRKLYGLQGIIPALPVPSLKDTVDQYLRSVRPLLSPEEHDRTKKLAFEFLNGIGPKLQGILVLKSWFFPNYIADWWEKYIYLGQRSSILISSNYYCMESLENPTKCQAAKAAFIAYHSLTVRKKVEDNALEPVMGQDIIPLCAWQYERMWNTCRVPGEPTDSLVHEHFSDHFVVYSKGRFYKVKAYSDDNRKRIFNLVELQLQFQRILGDSSVPADGEEKLAALTAWDRVSWANARQKYFSCGTNKRSLDAIEKAAFIICLDEDEYSFDINDLDTSKFEHYARGLFHGNGHNRWLDKSVNFIVGSNGRAGAHCEHSWGDAPVGCHTWEISLRACLDFDRFDDKGYIAGSTVVEPPVPERLAWELSEECLCDIELASACARKLIDNLDLKLMPFLDFGRGLIKKCGVSPDAYVQLALQLAYYRNQGEFHLTYEASMTRLYLQGRTETVRVCTDESTRWVLSVVNGMAKEEQVKLFKEACERHQMNYRDAMSGKGIDRHLLGLYVAAKYMGKESVFLEEALKMPWKLSTSQTPVSQTKLKPPMIPGGGFGPVSEDGYGVSYIFTGEDMLFFHVSSNRNCPKTDSSKFVMEIRQALVDIREMCGL